MYYVMSKVRTTQNYNFAKFHLTERWKIRHEY